MLSNIEVILLSILNEKPSYGYEINKTAYAVLLGRPDRFKLYTLTAQIKHPCRAE